MDNMFRSEGYKPTTRTGLRSRLTRFPHNGPDRSSQSLIRTRPGCLLQMPSSSGARGIHADGLHRSPTGELRGDVTPDGFSRTGGSRLMGNLQEKLLAAHAPLECPQDTPIGLLPRRRIHVEDSGSPSIVNRRHKVR